MKILKYIRFRLDFASFKSHMHLNQILGPVLKTRSFGIYIYICIFEFKYLTPPLPKFPKRVFELSGVVVAVVPVVPPNIPPVKLSGLEAAVVAEVLPKTPKGDAVVLAA